MHIHATVNKANFANFQAKLRKLFTVTDAALRTMTYETYWKDKRFDEFFISAEVPKRLSFSQVRWQELIADIAEGKVVTEEYEDAISFNVFPSLWDMEYDPQLCFIELTVPIKHIKA